MKKQFGSLIWNIAEFLDIPLGILTPIVFGWMIGSKGIRVDDRA